MTPGKMTATEIGARQDTTTFQIKLRILSSVCSPSYVVFNSSFWKSKAFIDSALIENLIMTTTLLHQRFSKGTRHFQTLEPNKDCTAWNINIYHKSKCHW